MVVLLPRLDDQRKCKLYMKSVVCKVAVEAFQHPACSGNLRVRTQTHVAVVKRIQPRCAEVKEFKPIN